MLAIDAGRIGGKPWKGHDATGLAKTKFFTDGETPVIHKEPHTLGRWPANVLLDEEAAAQLDRQSGNRPGDPLNRKPRTKRADGFGWSGPALQSHTTVGHSDSGGASRFFYCAKASRSERNAGLEGMPVSNNMRVNGPRKSEAAKHATLHANTHPTVKPIKLCEYLARLILPPERHTPRKLLVPFSGSGSEMLGARKAGWDQITGIEISSEYVGIARKRLKAAA